MPMRLLYRGLLPAEQNYSRFSEMLLDSILALAFIELFFYYKHSSIL
jgi:hypothetical protein